MIVASFFTSFWPNFTATMIAVVVGIPAGLWLNRRAEESAAEARAVEQRHEYDRRLSEERLRTCEALEQLEPVVRAHKSWFAILGAWGNLNEIFDGPLSELWVILRGQVVPSHLTDRRLFGDLGIHFERCTRLDELVRLRASLSRAGPSAQQEQVVIDQQAVQTRINNIKNAEGADPEKIASRVKVEIDQLRLGA